MPTQGASCSGTGRHPAGRVPAAPRRGRPVHRRRLRRPLARDGEGSAGASRRQRLVQRIVEAIRATHVGTSEPVSQDLASPNVHPAARKAGGSPELATPAEPRTEDVRTRVGFPPPPPFTQGQPFSVGLFLCGILRVRGRSWGFLRTSRIGLPPCGYSPRENKNCEDVIYTRRNW